MCVHVSIHSVSIYIQISTSDTAFINLSFFPTKYVHNHRIQSPEIANPGDSSVTD